MTINTRLASSMVDEWLCSPDQPRTAQDKEASGDGVNSQQVQEVMCTRVHFFSRPYRVRGIRDGFHDHKLK